MFEFISCLYFLCGLLEKNLTHTTQHQENNPIKKWAEDWNRHFSKENIQMVGRQMERCSMLLIVREMKIKTTMRYHLTPVRMAIINKSINSKCWPGCGEKEPSLTVGGNADWCSHYGKQYRGSPKIKNGTAL